jgi:hypothetical protein
MEKEVRRWHYSCPLRDAQPSRFLYSAFEISRKNLKMVALLASHSRRAFLEVRQVARSILPSS